MKIKLQELGLVCKSMMREVVAVIVLCMEAVGVREFDLDELLSACIEVSRKTARFTMKSATSQLLSVSDASGLVDAVKKMKEDLTHLRVVIYVQGTREVVHDTQVTQEMQEPVQETLKTVQRLEASTLNSGLQRKVSMEMAAMMGRDNSGDGSGRRGDGDSECRNGGSEDGDAGNDRLSDRDRGNGDSDDADDGNGDACSPTGIYTLEG